MRPVIAWNMVPAIDIIRPIVEPPPEYKRYYSIHILLLAKIQNKQVMLYGLL